jgi:hypothetical protein
MGMCLYVNTKMEKEMERLYIVMQMDDKSLEDMKMDRK